MNSRSRHNFVRAAERLQAGYAASRAARRAEFEAMAAAGAFRAPDHLHPALQGDLGLAPAAPMAADDIRAEAA